MPWRNNERYALGKQAADAPHLFGGLPVPYASLKGQSICVGRMVGPVALLKGAWWALLEAQYGSALVYVRDRHREQLSDD